MSNQYDVLQRYNKVWSEATRRGQGPIIPTLEEEHIVGSLRPETTSLTAEIGGRLIHLTNGEAAFGADAQVQADLAALEELQAS